MDVQGWLRKQLEDLGKARRPRHEASRIAVRPQTPSRGASFRQTSLGIAGQDLSIRCGHACWEGLCVSD
jgi:hypothetical protein